ncbi:MAG TPA: transglycosylase SLT domain-containing protein [Virgibacillus sp.]|nr:transglycosylase SLT domain-containing protein [Virgibacillus sp.]
MNTQLIRERIAFILIILLLMIFIAIFFLTIRSHISSLKKENNQLQLEKSSLQLERDVTQTNGVLNTSDNGYYQWLNLDEKADAFVDDSDGKFDKSWALYLVNESYNFDIDPHIPYELLKVETGGTFDPTLIGPKTKYGRAYGLGQFMKNTAPWIADMSDVEYDDDLLFDPYYSIHLTYVYLDFLHEQYDNWHQALTAYHRGINGLDKYMEKNGHAKSEYATEILQGVKED